MGLPYMGVDFRVPLYNMPTENSPFLLNALFENGRLKKRDAHSSVLDVAADGQIVAIIPSTGSRVITIGTTTTRDTGGSSVASPTITGINPVNWIFYRNNILIPITLAGAGTVYNLDLSAFTWGAGLTYTYVNTAPAPSICTYRERVYVASGKALFYGGVGSVGPAAMTAFTTNFPENESVGDIAAISPFSLQEGGVSQQFLVVVFTGGTVMMYTGDDPSATDWQVALRFELGGFPRASATDNPVKITLVPGDMLIYPAFGEDVFSLRQLLEKGLGQGTYLPFAPVKALFTQHKFMSVSSFFGRKNVQYWPDRNSIVIIYNCFYSSFEYFTKWDTDIGIITGATPDILPFIVTIDLITGSIALHANNSGTMAIDPGSAVFNAGNIYAIGVDYSNISKLILRLFDKDSSTPYQDFGNTSYSMVVSMPPLAIAGYRLKTLSNLIMYSNLNTNHALQYSINKNFTIGPSTYYSIPTANTSNEVQADILGAVGTCPTFSVVLRETSTASTGFEFFGMDALLEDGADF
jgi:hypothetical protein